MKSEIQRILENANEELGENTFLCRSYSGRGMYGSKCLGVVVDSDQIGSLFAELVRGTPEEDEEDWHNRRECLTNEIESMRMDNMGLSVIIYFTRAQYTEPEEEEDAAE